MQYRAEHSRGTGCGGAKNSGIRKLWDEMLAVIEGYHAFSDIDRLVYCAGRRGGMYRSTRDLADDPATYRKIRNLIEQVGAEKGADGVEAFISEMVDRYI